MTLGRELKRQGIEIITHASCTGIDTGENLGATVHYTNADDESLSVEADVVLVAIGRQAATDADWFSSAGIELTERGLVKTNELGREQCEACLGGWRHHARAPTGAPRLRAGHHRRRGHRGLEAQAGRQCQHPSSGVFHS
jgi:NADPH-dependent 2,4-dienoyl-CoA reductase/sulfur reductase-like enzyme